MRSQTSAPECFLWVAERTEEMASSQEPSIKKEHRTNNKANVMTQDIKEARYEGYLWHSDQSTPEMLMGQTPKAITLKDGENPFITEGLLWNEENKETISIRYVDGHYFVSSHKISPEQVTTPVSYLPHRLPGIKSLKFMRLWEKEQDPLCEGMNTLQLKANLFVGFEK